MSNPSRKSDASQTPDEAAPGDSALDFVVLADSVSNSDGDSLGGLGTAMAPSCPAPLEPHLSDTKPVTLDDFKRGDRIDDFEILALLGRGAFGAVYLARQTSLDREVALKITAWQASEGRKMARLEHENIVQVFSEVSIDSGTMLLCMQYVPGPTLQAVLDSMAMTDRKNWSGRLLLETVDRLTARPAPFDPASARNREALEALDWVETVCWIGARLAEALDYAHARGVVHRDIKPGNIMISQYGRPMLVDFNLASQRLGNAQGDDNIGGTLAYMAPEYLDAFTSGENLPPDTAPHAADIYSLGVVIYQTASGELPFSVTPEGKSKSEILRAMVDQRHHFPPPLPPDLPKDLDQIVTQCMNPDPAQRYGSARELRAALQGCGQFRSAEREIPDLGRMISIVAKHPFLWLLILSLTPHIVATFLNIAYNQVRIISHLTNAQQATFGYVILGYDSFSYTSGLIIAALVIRPVWRAWRLVRERMPADAAAIDSGRRMAVAWPRVAAWCACLGWIPGGIVFPICLRQVSGTLALSQWVHLFISFAISGLIALTYSMLSVQWLSLCVMYLRLWAHRKAFRETAKAELQDVPRRLRLLQILAGVIPLAGAVLILFGDTSEQPRDFRVLVASLIILGAGGFCLAIFATTFLTRALAAITGADEISKKKPSRP